MASDTQITSLANEYRYPHLLTNTPLLWRKNDGALIAWTRDAAQPTLGFEFEFSVDSTTVLSVSLDGLEYFVYVARDLSIFSSNLKELESGSEYFTLSFNLRICTCYIQCSWLNQPATPYQLRYNQKSKPIVLYEGKQGHVVTFRAKPVCDALIMILARHQKECRKAFRSLHRVVGYIDTQHDAAMRKFCIGDVEVESRKFNLKEQIDCQLGFPAREWWTAHYDARGALMFSVSPDLANKTLIINREQFVSLAPYVIEKSIVHAPHGEVSSAEHMAPTVGFLDEANAAHSLIEGLSGSMELEQLAPEHLLEPDTRHDLVSELARQLRESASSSLNSSPSGPKDESEEEEDDDEEEEPMRLAYEASSPESETESSSDSEPEAIQGEDAHDHVASDVMAQDREPSSNRTTDASTIGQFQPCIGPPCYDSFWSSFKPDHVPLTPSGLPDLWNPVRLLVSCRKCKGCSKMAPTFYANQGVIFKTLNKESNIFFCQECATTRIERVTKNNGQALQLDRTTKLDAVGRRLVQKIRKDLIGAFQLPMLNPTQVGYTWDLYNMSSTLRPFLAEADSTERLEHYARLCLTFPS